jgi:hypothetical protein
MAMFKGQTSGGKKVAEEQSAGQAPFLSAAFWDEGTRICFEVLSTHRSGNGPYVGVKLINGLTVLGPDSKPQWPETAEKVRIDGESHSLVRIGNLAGITLARMEALAEAKNKYFAEGDKVFLICTGITPPEEEGHSPSPNFALEIDRAPEVSVPEVRSDKKAASKRTAAA